MLSEAEGCAVLRACFTGAGYGIEENVPFAEQGLLVHLDGWDPRLRVGYEYLTREAQDEREFTPEVVRALEARIAGGELYLFLIDEHDVTEGRSLREAALGFLSRLPEAARARVGSEGGMP